MSEWLVAEVPRRNPFRILELPLLLRFQRYADSRPGRLQRRLLSKLAKAAFRTVHYRLGLGAWGRLRLELGDGEAAELRFDGRNTHYGALARPGAEHGYEPETASLLDRIVPDDGVFFDVGANWGPFSLLIASRPGFTGEIHAFEPASRVRADLALLVAQAGLADRVVCHGEALSDRAGQGRMAAGMHSALGRLKRDEHDGKGEAVTTARLDDLDLPPPGVMKIDVEGHEASVLEGARRTIARHRPMIVLESWYRPDDAAATLAPLQFLAAMDYALFRPMWRLAGAGGSYLSPSPAGGSPAGVGTLALLPFAAGDRLALGADFNAFACPREALDTPLFGPWTKQQG